MSNSSTEAANRFSYVSRANAAYIDGIYRAYQEDPSSVEESWRYFFEGYEFGQTNESSQASGGSHVDSQIEIYINLVRRLGHRSAHLNPLAPKPDLIDELLPENLGLGSLDPKHKFLSSTLPGNSPRTWAEIQDFVLRTYCRSIGADFRDIPNMAGIIWFQQQMESCENKPVFSSDAKLRILDKLIVAEGFERFVGDRFLGQKRFSLEGLEALVPLMDFLTDQACAGGLEEICIGMAHRGRLNILANYMGKPFEAMMKEFEGSDHYTHDIDGDVKYHMGYANYIETMSGTKARAYLSPNPSHLEAVYPVVEGFTRSRQHMLSDSERHKVVPVLMHGDGSFIGQGVIAETLNLSALNSYTTGGTIHIVLNNQVGFTTDPRESRSCYYSTDIAKIVGAPVLHVNADDPEAVIWAGELALKYRQMFKSDVVVELVGYRRHGHNETDEPTFTQPVMYSIIKDHPTVLTQYAQRLIGEGVLDAEAFDTKVKSFREKLQSCLDRVRSGNFETLTTLPKELIESITSVKVTESELFNSVKTLVPKKELLEVVQSICKTPADFNVHPKISKLLKNRLAMIEGEGSLDWGLGELLAFGTLAKDGYHVRLSGQDCQRGTFSHRHGVIRDFETGRSLHLLNQIGKGQAEVHIINSPLSEMGVMGFEFGYSVANKKALVLWEAQFGDFCNGAQIIIDQFLAASEAKWKQVCNLVLLLPHGYEGMGPEHSSARPERFLQLCGNNNIQVANLTTPAQLFHILRRQSIRPFHKPLIILSPKSLLRHPKVVSTIAEFTKGEFKEVLDDATVKSAKSIERVVFCTGKIYYELEEARSANQIENVALVRIEQLYPFPDAAVATVLAKYTEAKEVLWTQEEPSNMGYWTFIRHRIKRLALKNASFR